MIIELRNLAVEEGYLPTMEEVPKIIIKSLYDTGAGQPLSPEVSKVRSIIGLKKEAYDVSTNKETLKKFQKLLDGLEITKKGGLR